MTGSFNYAEHMQVTVYAGSAHKAEDYFGTASSGTYTITEDGRLKLLPQDKTYEIYNISLNGNSLTIDGSTYKKIN